MPNHYNDPTFSEAAGDFFGQLIGLPGSADITGTEEVSGSPLDRFATIGRERFRGIPRGAAHHASISESAAKKFGFLPTQIGGVGIELLEHAAGANRTPESRKDTIADFIANAGGGLAGISPNFARVPIRSITGALAGPASEIISSLLEERLR